MKPSITQDDDRFEVRAGFSRRSMAWEEIGRILCRNVDKITYEELFLIFESSNYIYIEVGELDRGFRDFEAGLLRNIHEFPGDWRAKMQHAIIDCPKIIWEKESSQSA